jgi:hypothetical protein
LAFYDSTQRNFGEVLDFTDMLPDLNGQVGYYIFEVYFQKIEFSQGMYSITIGLANSPDNEHRNISEKIATYYTVRGKHYGQVPM